MKRFTFLFACLVVAIVANAQQETQKTDNEMQTLFGRDGKPELGWFIGIDAGFTAFDDREVWLSGISLGMVIDHKYIIGLSGHGVSNRDGMFYPDITDSSGGYFEGGYGGLLLEYTLFPESIVHLTFPILIGGGAASYVSDKEYPEWDEDEWDTHHVNLDEDVFFVFEPGARVEINLLKFMKFDAGVSYRYVGDLQMVNTSKDMMNNFTVTMGLKFGKF